jgi:protein-S-isoprenylcysteine O-methyltransferase Ste14
VNTLKTGITVVWIVVLIYWVASAFGAKRGTGGGRRIPATGVTALAVALVVRVFRGGGLAVHSPVLGAIGAVLFAAGIAVTIWARICLGRNWGMPMTEKTEPELVTSGPYQFVRHPIYSGLLLALLGTALATNLIGLLILAVLAAYFYYCATVEEKNLSETFPAAYPDYRERTKMLIPLVL